MNIERFFHEHPIFRHEEFVAWKLEQGPIQVSSLNMALQYYVKTGRITQIRRKLYAVLPPNQTPATITIDPYLLTGKSALDSILAYHTALELHGVAYSAFNQFNYLSKHKNKPFEFHGQWFQAVAHPTILQKKMRISFGVQIINRQGLDIQITDSARTFVDVLDRVELCGGWEEVCRSINNIAVLNCDEVIEYCLMLGNARLAAKVGYFLEQRQGAFAVNEAQLKRLLDAKPIIPQYVSKRGHEKFQLIKKWNLLIPVSVINKSWEEPNVDF